MLVLEALEKRYGSVPALRGLDLTVAEGELLAVLGPSGSGKSTALRVIAGLAGTSPAAVYELFGDKAGVIRALFFSGFARMAEALGDDRDLRVLAERYRAFVVAHPALAAVMFSRPFSSFDPAPEESAAGAAVRGRIVAAVRDAIAAGDLEGDATDISHAYVALIQGLAAAESAGRLGTSDASVQRRWDTAVAGLLRGFAPA